MKAMIFAAGLGKRLGNITETVPKALVDINGKTALHRAVERCSSYGFNEIIVNVHHLADLVETEVKKLISLGFDINISDERDKILDTGGGLFKARWFFDDSPFLIHNVDIISDLDLKSLYNFHLEKRGLATLSVRERPGTRVYLVDNSGRIRGWRNRSTHEQILAGDITLELSEIAFSSMHIANPEIFKYMQEGVYSLTALYLELAKKHNIFTYREDGGYWFDIGTPENLEEVRRFFESDQSIHPLQL